MLEPMTLQHGRCEIPRSPFVDVSLSLISLSHLVHCHPIVAAPVSVRPVMFTPAPVWVIFDAFAKERLLTGVA